MVTNQISAFVLGTHWVARVCILLVVVPVRRVRDTCSTGLSIVLGHACRARASLSLSLSFPLNGNLNDNLIYKSKVAKNPQYESRNKTPTIPNPGGETDITTRTVFLLCWLLLFLFLLCWLLFVCSVAWVFTCRLLDKSFELLVGFFLLNNP